MRLTGNTMTVYVAEIRGRGIVAFNANKAAEAEDLVRDPATLDDLMVLETGGLPLWDGVTEIYVRQALQQRRRNGRHHEPRQSAMVMSMTVKTKFGLPSSFR